MDNKEQNLSSFEFDKGTPSNDYKSLVKKLKSIKEIISYLEKNFLEKKI